MKNEMESEFKEPLLWPDGQPRTRLGDRKDQAAWKLPLAKSKDLLILELRRLKVTSALITHNSQSNPDSGVAVYFSLRPDDHEAWQEALGFVGEVPTLEQISHAYKERAKKVHPDGPTPDRVVFDSLTKHRDRAVAWAKGDEKKEYEKVMAVDSFKDMRLNINAIRLVLSALRQIERCGAPMMMERAFRGFHKALSVGGSQ